MWLFQVECKKGWSDHVQYSSFDIHLSECILFTCCYIVVCLRSQWIICPCFSGMFHWHEDNRMIIPVSMDKGKFDVYQLYHIIKYMVYIIMMLMHVTVSQFTGKFRCLWKSLFKLKNQIRSALSFLCDGNLSVISLKKGITTGSCSMGLVTDT